MVQMTCVESRQANIDHAAREIKKAAAKGAQVVCLQELFASRYFCHEENYGNFWLAESIPGPSTKALQDLAKECNTVIIASLF